MNAAEQPRRPAADHPAPEASRSVWFTRYAWTFVAYLIFVILYGAWVRITHSGAGCGDHWPMCNGEVIPFAPSTETIIEYTHRLTSGALGILALALVVWAAVRFGRRHRVYWAAVVTLVFIIFEALIGAGIVLQGLVTDDSSVARAVVISIHLVNTLMLTGAAGLTAWWSTGGARPTWRQTGSLKWLLLVGLLGIIATSMTGAVTALGDTLFPVDPTVGEGLFQRVRDDLSPANHFLVRLRILHPVIAVASAGYLVALTVIVRTSEVSQTTRRWAVAALVTVVANVALGVLNIYLAAPGWLQMTHLAVAQLVWLTALVMAIEALDAPAHEG